MRCCFNEATQNKEKNTMKTLCIYHGVDFDGYCSAAIVKKAIQNTTCIGTNHGQPTYFMEKIDKSTIVIIVDFSFPKPIMENIISKAADVIWIDHHKTAIDALEGFNLQGIRDTKKAACILTWEYFFSDLEMPLPVKMIGSYDIWEHTPDILKLNSFLQSLKKEERFADAPIWKDLLSNNININKYLEIGTYIEKYITVQNEIKNP